MSSVGRLSLRRSKSSPSKIRRQKSSPAPKSKTIRRKYTGPGKPEKYLIHEFFRLLAVSSEEIGAYRGTYPREKNSSAGVVRKLIATERIKDNTQLGKNRRRLVKRAMENWIMGLSAEDQQNLSTQLIQEVLVNNKAGTTSAIKALNAVQATVSDKDKKLSMSLTTGANVNHAQSILDFLKKKQKADTVPNVPVASVATKKPGSDGSDGSDGSGGSDGSEGSDGDEADSSTLYDMMQDIMAETNRDGGPKSRRRIEPMPQPQRRVAKVPKAAPKKFDDIDKDSALMNALIKMVYVNTHLYRERDGDPLSRVKIDYNDMYLEMKAIAKEWYNITIRSNKEYLKRGDRAKGRRNAKTVGDIEGIMEGVAAKNFVIAMLKKVPDEYPLLTPDNFVPSSSTDDDDSDNYGSNSDVDSLGNVSVDSAKEINQNINLSVSGVDKEDFIPLVLSSKIYGAPGTRPDEIGTYKIDTQKERAGAWVDEKNGRILIALEGMTAESALEVGSVEVGIRELSATKSYKELKLLVDAQRLKYPGFKFEFTGHSAGGTLALAISQELKGTTAVAFAPSLDGRYKQPLDTKIYATRIDVVTKNAAIDANSRILVMKNTILDGMLQAHAIDAYIAATLDSDPSGSFDTLLIKAASDERGGSTTGGVRGGRSNNSELYSKDVKYREHSFDPRGKSDFVLRLLARRKGKINQQKLNSIQAFSNLIAKENPRAMDRIAAKAGVIAWDSVSENMKAQVLAAKIVQLAQTDRKKIRTIFGTRKNPVTFNDADPSPTNADGRRMAATADGDKGTLPPLTDDMTVPAQQQEATTVPAQQPPPPAQQPQPRLQEPLPQEGQPPFREKQDDAGSPAIGARAEAAQLGVPALGASNYATTLSPLLDSVLPKFRKAVQLAFHNKGDSFRAYEFDNGSNDVKQILKEIYQGRTKVNHTEIIGASQAILDNYGHLLGISQPCNAGDYEPISLLSLLACLLARYREPSANTLGGGNGGNKEISNENLSELSDEELEAAVAGRPVEVLLRSDIKAAEIRTMLPRKSNKTNSPNSASGSATPPTNIDEERKIAEAIRPLNAVTETFQYRDLRFAEPVAHIPHVEYNFTVL